MRSKVAKVLHPLGGEPMVAYVVETCRQLSLSRILVVVGYQEDKVREALAGFSVECVTQKEQKGTGHALLQAEELLHDFQGLLLVLNGDVPLLLPETLTRLITHHREASAQATFLTARLSNPMGYGRVIRAANGSFLRIVEEPEATQEEKQVTEINAGVYCFTMGPLFAALKRIRPSAVKKELYLPEVLRILPENGFRVEALPVAGPQEVTGINTRADLAEAEAILRRRILTRLMAEGVTVVDPAVTYVGPSVTVAPDVLLYPHVFLEGRTVIGEGTVIYPHCRIRDSHIGAGVTLLDGCIITESEIAEGATVGPYAHLRPASRVGKGAKVGNFVEVKKSTIGQGSKVPHLSYIGDATIGARVNVGAGAITCNYDGEKKAETVIADEAFVGSNTNLVAPVTVGKGAYIASGSTITEDVPPETLAIARARQVNKVGRPPRRKKQRDEGQER